MASNITNQKYLDGVPPLAEPHFDEEATVLSAQRVVPLREIKTEEGSRKRLAFGVAMVFSLLVGALSATLIYKQRGQKEVAPIVNTAIPGVDGIVVDQPASRPTVAENIGEAGTGSLPEGGVPTGDQNPSSLSSVAAQSAQLTPRQKRMTHQTYESDLSRSERIESRHLRLKSEREAEKEPRRNQRKSDDLLRIREIFEGPPRP